MTTWTNAGRRLAEDALFGRRDAPGGFFVALVQEGSVPSEDTASMSELAEVKGGGYKPVRLERGNKSFLRLTEAAPEIITVKDVSWLAEGSPLRARWAVLTTAEKSASKRTVVAFWDLEHERQVSEQQELTLRQMGLGLA